jgi:hypothetical protein
VDAIKIACDHVSIQHLDQIEQLIVEFREQRLASGHGEDVLQFYTMLWYAWLSLRQLREKVPAGKPLGAVLDSSIDEDISMAEPGDGLGSSNSSSNLVHGSSSAAPVDSRFPAAHNQHNGAAAATSKRVWQKQKNKANKRAKVTGARPYNPVTEFPCPFCSRILGRSGLIDHV